MNWQLFFSTFALIFVAELPDKTAFATLLMATRENPAAIFVGACTAFLVQSVVAVCFGSVFALFPERWVHLAAGVLFLIFAFLALRQGGDEEKSEEPGNAGSKSFWRSVRSSFLVIFIAEWGDLTQLVTASLVARVHQPLTIFIAATLALWTATGIAVVVGSRLKKLIQPHLLSRLAACAFIAVGIYFIYDWMQGF